jgi:hypothetical protein
VDAVPSTEWFSWGRNLCRGLDDNANARTKLVRFFEDPDGLYDFGWDAEPIAGCIMTVDSSSGDVERLLPAVHFMRRKNPRLMPVLIVDAHQNLEFQHSILIEHGFYTCRDFYRWDGNAIDPSSVLQFFSVIIQSLRIAHHLVRDRTVHEAGRSILNQLMKV